ncbi:MAG: hypothetical protein QGG36_02335 [Pirellulaceae bacterium]|jgi:predicted transcriptional regulator|nr:hypothetical protein [Pirellulaceae bacterium]
MNPKLSPELSAALHQAPTDSLEVVDPDTNRVYLLCDPALQQRAKELLDTQAIAEGYADVQAGRTQPVDEAFADIRRNLGFSSH